MIKTVKIGIGGGYNAYIGEGALDEGGIIIRDAAALCQKAMPKLCVIADEAAAGLHYLRLKRSLDAVGFETELITVSGGEEVKTFDTAAYLYKRLAELGVRRGDVLVAFGGGAVGDIVGFVAATYMRGVRLVHVPTTLLAQIDSSIGGKSAIDVGEVKNLAGAFWQPVCVISDTTVLKTLPERQLRSGMAEAVKYGCIADRTLFDELSELPLEETVLRCVRIKADYVSRDVFDTGVRRELNFGHTFGHAVEAASGYGLTHGEAVAIGMVMAAKIAARLGILDKGTEAAIAGRLEEFGLPTGYDAENLTDRIKSDKKSESGGVNMVLPTKIGEVIIKNLSFERLGELM